MQLSRKINGKKFMWDGNEYGSEMEAKTTSEKYSRDGFETEIVEENGKFYLFTRRVVKEIKIES